MRLVDMILAVIRPERERAAKGRAIVDSEVRAKAQIDRAERLVSQRRVNGYRQVRLPR